MACQEDDARKSSGLMLRSLPRSCDCLTIDGASRRDFSKMLLGAAAAGVALGYPRSSPASVREQPPGIKLCQRASLNPSDDEILFLKQLGFEHVFCTTPS